MTSRVTGWPLAGNLRAIYWMTLSGNFFSLAQTWDPELGPGLVVPGMSYISFQNRTASLSLRPNPVSTNMSD